MKYIYIGIVASCQNERSQHQNKATAMSVLQSRLDVLNRGKQHDAKQSSTIGVGDISWGNQIRSIVMQPYQMVKDHRTGEYIYIYIYIYSYPLNPLFIDYTSLMMMFT
jgi:peptide chain release factor 2